MSFTILSIKRRNILARSVSIDHWQVKVRLDSGEEMTLNCWAGTRTPKESWLIDDLKKKIRQRLHPKPKPKPVDFKKLEGKTFDIELIQK